MKLTVENGIENPDGTVEIGLYDVGCEVRVRAKKGDKLTDLIAISEDGDVVLIGDFTNGIRGKNPIAELGFKTAGDGYIDVWNKQDLLSN